MDRKRIYYARGDRIIAKGTSQRLRGRSQLGLRYTNIILDDFESELNTKTPDRRREIKEWVNVYGRARIRKLKRTRRVNMAYWYNSPLRLFSSRRI